MKTFNILHFSDLHFGKFSICYKEAIKGSFLNYFEHLRQALDKIKYDKVKRPHVVLISGDIGSKGQIPLDYEETDFSYLLGFLKIFSDEKIPILICNGNHDLDRITIEQGNQFESFVNSINQIQNFLGCGLYESYSYQLSKNFKRNQASYIYFENFCTLFLSVNSCQSIEKSSIGVSYSGEELLDKRKLDIGTLNLREFTNLIDEIENEIGEKKYSEALKFLLCHHPLNKLEESKRILDYLDNKKIKIIFSGHTHNFDFRQDERWGIIGYAAGSPFVVPEERTDPVDLMTYPLQFSRYFIDLNREIIQPYLYSGNIFCRWTEEKLERVGFAFYKLDSESTYWIIAPSSAVPIEANRTIHVVEKREIPVNGPELPRYEGNFLDDFLEYWEYVKGLISPKGGKPMNWLKWKDISRDVIFKQTKLFYEKYKHLSNIVWINAYIKTFYSIIIDFRESSILIPYQIILFETSRPRNDFVMNFKKNRADIDLVKVLSPLVEDLNIKLNKTDIELIQKIVDPSFSKSLDNFPTFKELSKEIQRTEQTIVQRLSYLIKKRILSIFYLVDLARIGYRTMYIFHDQKIKNSFQPYVALSFPLTPINEFLTILQYPYNDTEFYSKIVKYLNPESRSILTSQYQGWNLRSISKNPNDRWREYPPLLQSGGNWEDLIIIDNNSGVTFNLDPHIDPYPLTVREARLIAYVHRLSTMEEDTLAKQLHISRAYIEKDWKNLLKNKIALRFPFFSNIGLESRIFFYIQDLEDSKAFSNVLLHLKSFPYVNIFYNNKIGHLIGYVNIAPQWTNRFIYQIVNLPKIFSGCKFYYYLGSDIQTPLGYDILKTLNWNRFENS